MTHDRHIHGKIDNATGMREVYTEIRGDVANAKSRPDLTELYKRAGYLITLTYAPSWEEKFGIDEAATLRAVGEHEFTKTAIKINDRAAQIGTEANYHEKWGHKT